MCGIVAYVGGREAQPLLLDALGRLEYRGYDSAGAAILHNGTLGICKKTGRIADLAQTLQASPLPGHTGICHTRWATHGKPSDANAHPHLDASGRLALVHNGVIDNFQALKDRLSAEGHRFQSQTDTEVLAHLIGAYYGAAAAPEESALVEALRRALGEVEGTFGVALVHADHPGLILGARRGSPLVVGLCDNGENFLASDAPALLPYTNKVIYLNDHDLVKLRAHQFEVEHFSGSRAAVEIQHLDLLPEAAEKGGFPHFMLKEIHEQPATIENAMRGRILHEEASAKFGGLNLTNEQLRDVGRLLILGSGTALHAAMVGEHLLESLAHLPVETDYGSEFRYRNVPLERNTLVFAISQSGETIDTLGALREARRKGFRVLGICNNVGSTIARESDGGVYMHAGPEICVAATKSFVSQVTILSLLAVLFGRMRFLSASQGRDMLHALEALPDQVRAILRQSESIRQVAEHYKDCRSMLYFGRHFNYPVALEGALKMKEISYIHAEGYPSSELKHGIIALVDPRTPSVVLVPRDSLYEKNLNNLQQIKARGGPIIAVAHEDDTTIGNLVDHVIPVPRTLEPLQAILNIVPLQLLAYHTAVALGRDVDKPRNLAKSVTVE
jgi:glutamine---fructose-6-phosphate transaminase (isomerizing)